MFRPFHIIILFLCSTLVEATSPAFSSVLLRGPLVSSSLPRTLPGSLATLRLCSVLAARPRWEWPAQHDNIYPHSRLQSPASIVLNTLCSIMCVSTLLATNFSYQVPFSDQFALFRAMTSTTTPPTVVVKLYHKGETVITSSSAGFRYLPLFFCLALTHFASL